MGTKIITIAVMNVTTTWPLAESSYKQRMAVAYAWDKRLRPDTDYVTGRTADGLADLAWAVEGVTPTNEFYSYKGKSGLRREQWLLAIPPVSLVELIGQEAVDQINADLRPGQYVVKYIEVEVEADDA